MELFINMAYVTVLSIVSLLTLFLLCKLIGQRQIGQMSMFDYINSISIGSMAAELATNRTEWEKPLTAMILWGALTALINYITCKSMTLRRLFAGKPVVLFENGAVCNRNLLKQKIDLNEFLTQCRAAGYFDLGQLNTVLLETNGRFSFLPKAENRPTTPSDFAQSPQPEPLWISLVLDGHLQEKNLKSSGFDKSWLMQKLGTEGIGQLHEVFFAACTVNGAFFACRRQTAAKEHDYFE